jgi:hypothetical protein
MRGIDVFYQLCYFLSLNARNAYIQGRREYVLTNKFISCHSFNYRQFHDRISDTNIKQTEYFLTSQIYAIIFFYCHQFHHRDQNAHGKG